MHTPESYYNQELEKFKKQVEQLKQRSNRLSFLRILVFLISAIVIYFFYSKSYVVVAVAFVGVSLFVKLLSLHTDVRTRKQLAQRLVLINSDEIEIARGNYLDRNEGLQFLTPNHSYAQDIDLYGRGSFFQYLNRTGLAAGTHKLAELMNSNQIEDITHKQEAIKELSEDSNWRQNFTALAMGLETDEEVHTIVNWLTGYKSFLRPLHLYLSMIFGVLSLVLIGLSFFQIIPLSFLGYWLLVGLTISSLFLKKVNTLAFKSSKAKEFFKQYGLLLLEIEERQFNSQLLQDLQNQIQSKGEKASEIFKKFSKALDALDHRNNLIVAVLGNGLFLMDIVRSIRIEKWIHEYSHKADDWFKAVAVFDAYNTFGTFAFNHQEYTYPQIVDSNVLIQAESLGHPLIRKEKRISSDLSINDANFFIITGANMAGKSTFLRSVALHILMANLGLPVCATRSCYRPIKLISSMRTSDSLADESSYFFSELTRLKYIVDQFESDRYFVILDEILKGTNSTDKAIGSKKFVERLVNLKASGIIATHDLSLTEIDQELSNVKNYFFDADIKNDELYFDYKLKEGICENMNASFLLRKMGIVK